MIHLEVLQQYSLRAVITFYKRKWFYWEILWSVISKIKKKQAMACFLMDYVLFLEKLKCIHLKNMHWVLTVYQILGAGDIASSRTKSLPSWSLRSSGEARQYTGTQICSVRKRLVLRRKLRRVSGQRVVETIVFFDKVVTSDLEIPQRS